MKQYDVVVVGGSAAGIPAAITSRRHYPDKSVLVLRRESQTVIPCGIPYVFGELSSCSQNMIPDGVLENNAIDFKVCDVSEIDREAKVVKTDDDQVFGYDRLVLATGSGPAVPPIPGREKKGVFAIEKSAPYLEHMLGAMNSAKNIVIVGCGFIGVELAEETIKNRDVNIRIVEMMRHCLQLTYDIEFSIRAEEELASQGIEILGSERVEGFLGGDKVEEVQLSSGRKIPADMVIIGIGASANTELAQAAGLEIGTTRGIAVNRYQQTSDPEIFACGDCAEKVSFYDGQPSGMKLASIATMEARIAGANLFRRRRSNQGVIGVYSTVLGNTAFCAAGLTEAMAKDKGYQVAVGVAEGPNRHPGSMPGMAPLKVKLVFEAGTLTLLGGQISGAKSGGELINAVSGLISNRMTADDIACFQTGTHPGLTASPIAYQLVNAAELAIAAER